MSVQARQRDIVRKSTSRILEMPLYSGEEIVTGSEQNQAGELATHDLTSITAALAATYSSATPTITTVPPLIFFHSLRAEERYSSWPVVPLSVPRHIEGHFSRNVSSGRGGFLFSAPSAAAIERWISLSRLRLRTLFLCKEYS